VDGATGEGAAGKNVSAAFEGMVLCPTHGYYAPVPGNATNTGCPACAMFRLTMVTGSNLDHSSCVVQIGSLQNRVLVLQDAIRKETADHKPSVATGLPCKCFLCKALRGEP
jgi:hypothetical protein